MQKQENKKYTTINNEREIEEETTVIKLYCKTA